MDAIIETAIRENIQTLEVLKKLIKEDVKRRPSDKNKAAFQVSDCISKLKIILPNYERKEPEPEPVQLLG